MEPLAVVGLSFNLPQGVSNDDAFWDVLISGRNLSSEWPENRGSADGFRSNKANAFYKGTVTKGHFLEDNPAAFDAPFFSITAHEAAGMDPQQRWMLEAAYHAFEQAGIPTEQLRGSQTAVFTASMADDYSRLNAKDPETMPRTAISGTTPSMLANKISWFFDLTGPSMHVDSACSSGMTALHLACQSLSDGSASQALVMGSSIILSPESTMLLSNMNFLSPDGISYSFDSRANGYARGEGVVALVIRPLSFALRRGDSIRAIIRSVGSNQDGRTPTLTQPSIKSQERLIRDVYSRAGLDFKNTRYIEAHGTGTQVGDPIELQAIKNVFENSRSEQEPLYIGSVKSNIGHMEAGSGLAGILKSIFVLERGIIPPNALFSKLNHEVASGSYWMTVPSQPVEWPTNALRRISVNSFGFGGSNSHAILDDAFHFLQERQLDSLCNQLALSPQLDPREPDALSNGHCNGNSNGDTHTHNSPIQMLGRMSDKTKSPGFAISNHLLVWSAHSEISLKAMLEKYNQYYRSDAARDKMIQRRLAYTLAARRSLMNWRAFCIMKVSDQTLSDIVASVSKPVRASTHNKAVIVFTGQGAQYGGMGKGLLVYSAFRETMEEAQKALTELGCTWSILDKINSPVNVALPQYSQVCCTALQIALFELLRCFGFVPNAVIGHSSGEIAAAYAAGALSLRSAMKVAFYRGLLAGKLGKDTNDSPGSMLAVNLPYSSIETYLRRCSMVLREGLWIACVNSPTNCTLSGTVFAIDTLKKQLDTDNIFSTKLSTGVAYHSPFMQGIAQTYSESIGKLDRRAVTTTADEIPMVSTVTGDLASSEALRTAQYWVDNLVNPVLFSKAVQAIVRHPSKLLGLSKSILITDFVELGPHSALRRPIKETVEGLCEQNTIRYYSALDRSQVPAETLLRLVGNLFCRGYPVSVPATMELGVDHPENLIIDGTKYPFDHSRTYWTESRISKGFRFKPAVPTDSLGARASDWNPLQPCWRNFLSANNMPWTRDHMVENNIVFPGTGFLVISVEAAREAAHPDLTISGFFIQDAHFLRPIIIPDGSSSEEVEISIRLSPIRKPFETKSTWSEVSVYMYHNSNWTQCFQAVIQVKYDEDESSLGSQHELAFERERTRRWHDEAVQTCSRSISSARFYTHCRENGFHYGPSFQLLESIKWDGINATVANVHVPLPLCHTESFVHPAVLDAAFHLGLVPGSGGSGDRISSMVPHQVFNTWFSAEGWASIKSKNLQLALQVTDAGQSRAETSISGLSPDGEPLFKMGRVVFASVSAARSTEGIKRDQRLIHHIDWKPQLSLLSSTQLTAICHSSWTPQLNEQPMVDFIQRLNTGLVLSCRHTLDSLTPDALQDASPDLQKFVASILRHIQLYEGSLSSRLASDAEIEELLSACERERPSWSLYTLIARNLRYILLGGTDPLDLIFSTNLAELVYRDTFDQICDQRLHRFIELASHENPDLRILEIGAGTGGMTRHILGCLHDIEEATGTAAYKNYTYTDISPSFLDKARSEFEDDRISFRVLDVEDDRPGQAICDGYYDLVIAGSVLHATKSLGASLRNVRNLMRPGGSLLFLEPVAPDSIYPTIGFGLLPGWWLSQDKFRVYSPLVREVEWDRLLRESGFSGTELVLRDYQDDRIHQCSIMVSRAVSNTNVNHLPPRHRSVIIVLIESVLIQAQLANDLKSKIDSSSCVDIAQLDPTLVASADIVITLFDIDSPFLSNLSKKSFMRLQSLFQQAKNLIWVTSTSMGSRDYPPYHHMAPGLLRTLRAEAPEKRIILLLVEDQLRERDYALRDSILQVLDAYAAGDGPEVELVLRDGHLCSGRMVEEIVLDKEIHSMTNLMEYYSPLGEGPPAKLDVSRFGMLDSLRLIEDPEAVPQKPLMEDESEIDVKAWGVNFRDLFVALGRLPGEQLGWDCAGVVLRSGPESKFRPGDRVGLGVPGGMRTQITARDQSLFPIPDTTTFEEAASFGIPACTAYYCLVEVARLQPGETVLIHSAAGGTGQMAVWIAKHCGAEVFVTVGNEEKRRFVIDTFDLPPTHVLYSRDTSFSQGIKRLTGGRGVDVILNSLSGEFLTASWSCIAPYGRFVEIGKADIAGNSSLPMANFRQNVSFFAVDLYHTGLARPDLLSETGQKVMNLLQNGSIRYPYPRHHFPVSQVEQAFRHMQSGLNIGRIIITLDPEDVVPKLLIKKPRWTFDPQASYLIVGGLGGIGRAIARWFVGKGARHLILPSRSGPASMAALQLVCELQNAGVQVTTPICDASSRESISEVLALCANTLPRIRGCINAAMALHNSMFESMTHTQWDLTVKSKVNASWNLHELLPPDVDFFVMLSSVTGIHGSIAQANYGAGCTFQDGLARYRTSRGLSAVSLDVGWMRTVGIIAEREDYTARREKARDMVPVETEELLALLDVYCRPGNGRLIGPGGQLHELREQVSIGATTPSIFLSRGEELIAQIRGRMYSGFHKLSQIAAPAAIDGPAREEDAWKRCAASFRQAKSAQDRIAVVVGAVVARLARALSIAAGEIDAEKSLSDYGVDSLMAVELRAWFRNDFGAALAVFDFMGGKAINTIAQVIVDRSEFRVDGAE